MEIIKSQKKEEIEISVDELQRNEVNDEQEQNMISHVQVVDSSKNSEENKYNDTQINNRQFHYIKQSCKLTNKASQTINMSHLSLKSCIVFLLLLSIVLVGIYKMIDQIYEIQHPQLQLQRRIASSRVNMVRQENSLVNDKEQIEVAQKSIHELSSNSEKQSLKQPIIQQKSIKQQQAESELRQKEKYIQQFEDKDKNDKKQYQQQLSQNLLNKDQTVDKTTEISNKNLNQNVKVEKIKVQNDQNNGKDVQAAVNTVNQQKPIEKPAPVIIQQHPPASNRVPHGKPQQQQAAQTHQSPPSAVNSPSSQSQPPSPKAFVPTAKAGISVQQALKWRSYQSMIELPLSADVDSNPLLLEQYLYYERKYNINQYTQLPICVVIPTFNNVQNNRYQDNLKSILQQNYTNYHVVVIDDKSEDNTGRMINQFIKTIDPKYGQKIKVIINQQRKMAMPNLRFAAMNQCKQEELFIIVDGDDLLIGRQVFKLFSAVMQQRNYWVMWTNFLSPKGAIGYSRQYPTAHKQANNYRKAGFVMSHLRAYYTKLFRLIKDQDLKDDNGEFFHAANDVAIGIPILEMAHKHVGYVPELNYYYNMYTGLNNHKVRLKEQKTNDKLIRKKPKYEPLKTLGFGQQVPKTDNIPQQDIPSITPTNLKIQKS